MKKVFIILLFAICALTSVFADSSRFYRNGEVIDTMYVNSPEGLRVRDNPILSANRICGLPDRLPVKVIAIGEEDTIDEITAPWIKILIPHYEWENVHVEYGWVFGGYLSGHNKEENKMYFYNRWCKLYTEILCSEFSISKSDFFEPTPSLQLFAEFRKTHKVISIRKDEMKNYDDPNKPFYIDYQNYLIENGTVCGRGESWISLTVKKNIQNSFGIKLGMTKDEIQAILGDFYAGNDKFAYYSFYDFADINFKFDKGVVNEIEIGFDGIGN